ncbi:MAG: hypothetical protein NC311_11750 [Muribaculaceae bacterium]|nr:hypothetical protein [Ruminococcus sp.]MCM1296206.1 hypothetical protein [Muribaculaceae bacterium]
MEYTLRIYKNEYQPAQINYIKGVSEVLEESDKVITIKGDETMLNKIQSAMFLSDERFKEVFPEYVTVAERQAITRQELDNLKATIANTLCDCIRDGVTDNNDFFWELRDFYLDKIAHFRI